MSVKDIYLHIGRGKTGTTAIQAYLAQQTELLRLDGIHYLSADGGAEGLGHQQFAKSFIKFLPKIMTPAINPAAAREQIAAEICDSSSQNILISSENLPLVDVHELSEFFRCLPVAARIRVILFARSQDELAESEYNQVVKLKLETRSAREYAEHVLEGADFYAEALKWEQVFGPDSVICRIYDAGRNDVIECFLNTLPGDLHHTRAGALDVVYGSENRSLGFMALTMLRLLNGIDIPERNMVYRQVTNALANMDLPAVLFNAAEARTIRESYAESNERFTKRYFGNAKPHLGGRRYSDEERDQIRERINQPEFTDRFLEMRRIRQSNDVLEGDKA